MSRVLQVLSGDIVDHIAGDPCKVSGPWLQQSVDSEAVHEMVDLIEEEIFERTVREIVPGVWANGALYRDPKGYRGILRFRDMNTNPTEVVRLFKSLVRFICRDLSTKEGKTLTPRGSYRSSPFYKMDLYECPVSFEVGP